MQIYLELLSRRRKLAILAYTHTPERREREGGGSRKPLFFASLFPPPSSSLSSSKSCQPSGRHLQPSGLVFFFSYDASAEAAACMHTYIGSVGTAATATNARRKKKKNGPVVVVKISALPAAARAWRSGGANRGREGAYIYLVQRGRGGKEPTLESEMTICQPPFFFFESVRCMRT